MNVYISLFAKAKSFKENYIPSDLITFIDFRNPDSIRLSVDH